MYTGCNGIKSERRLEEEVSLNLAYRWFCGIDLMYRVPDHSTFSQNRKRRFQEAGIFREIFNEIVLKCIELGIVSGETGVADGSFLPSNVSWESRYEAVETVQRSTVKYMEELEAELSSMPGIHCHLHQITQPLFTSLVDITTLWICPAF